MSTAEVMEVAMVAIHGAMDAFHARFWIRIPALGMSRAWFLLRP